MENIYVKCVHLADFPLAIHNQQPTTRIHPLSTAFLTFQHFIHFPIHPPYLHLHSSTSTFPTSFSNHQNLKLFFLFPLNCVNSCPSSTVFPFCPLFTHKNTNNVSKDIKLKYPRNMKYPFTHSLSLSTIKHMVSSLNKSDRQNTFSFSMSNNKIKDEISPLLIHSYHKFYLFCVLCI